MDLEAILPRVEYASGGVGGKGLLSSFEDT